MTGLRDSRVLAVLASVVMAGAVVAGLFVLGPPSHQRSLRLDQHRVADLNMIVSVVTGYWMTHHALPPDLQAAGLQVENSRDPVTKEPYGYATTGRRSFRLCARFDLPSEPDMSGQLWQGIFSSHPEGRHCADQVVGTP